MENEREKGRGKRGLKGSSKREEKEIERRGKKWEKHGKKVGKGGK